MKRIAIIVVMALLSLEVSARSVHYFTFSQASRTVSYLNAQREMMIYCGYEYEIPTYVLINEVWMERVNSAYYELWVYGYDAYTGDEIYMPLDLQCVWLYSGGRMYNAAQYLRFRVEVRMPTLTWYIPPYLPYTRVMHRPGYLRSYHYDIHRHGWMPPAYTYGPGMPPPPLPYYYMRPPTAPAPMPSGSWTPGTNRPSVSVPEQTRDHNPSTGTQVRSSHSSSSATPSGRTTGGSREGSTTESSTRTSGSDNGTATTRERSSSESRGTSATRTETESRGSSTSRSSAETRGTTPTRSTVESRGTTEPATTSRTTNSTRSTSTRATSPSSSRASGSSSTNGRSESSTRTSSTRSTSSRNSR